MIMVRGPPHQHQHLAPGCSGLCMDGASTCGTHAAVSKDADHCQATVRGVGIPSRTLSRIALHAVRHGSRSRRLDEKSRSLRFALRPPVTPSYLRARGSLAARGGMVAASAHTPRHHASYAPSLTTADRRLAGLQGAEVQ